MSLMKLPDWFLLIREWKAKGMGAVGITLPFLVGALATKDKGARPSAQDIRSLLREIASKPVEGYVTEVRWCPNVEAPVLSVSTLSATLPFKSHFSSAIGQPSLGFSQDIQSMFGLNCNGSEECLEALVNDARASVEAGTYSRNTNSNTWKREYGPFSEPEKAFIREVIGAVET